MNYSEQDLRESHKAATHVLCLPSSGTQAISTEGSVLFVGTATVIIKYAGFTILTDPNFLHAGDHVHLGMGITAKRVTNPAVELEEVNSTSKIDFIVLSHFHEDHFDKYVQEHLNKEIPIVTTPHGVDCLTDLGFKRTFPLLTWEKIHVVRENTDSYVSITAMPGQHSPVAALESIALPPTMGSLLEFGSSGGSPGRQKPCYRIYISGDTLLFDELHLIPQRFPHINLGLFHLGGTTLPMGIIVTMDAKQGIEAVKIINPEHVIPIHYNDYDRFLSPLEDFKKEVEKSSYKDKVTYLKHGETYTFRAACAP